MTGPYPDPDVAQRIRATLAALGEPVPLLRRVMSWRPRHRQHVERWAAREFLVRAGDHRRRLLRPAVLG